MAEIPMRPQICVSGRPFEELKVYIHHIYHERTKLEKGTAEDKMEELFEVPD
jgi:predicted glycosyltransferase involved in capsule biosynthesis